MVYLFLAEGFEEVEAITPIDYLRRAGIDVTTVGIGGTQITGAHGITVNTDICECALNENSESADMIILPGGMPGTLNLKASETVISFIKKAAENNAYIGAICAAPSILGEMGLLQGKRAVCYPGFEDKLLGARLCDCNAVRDGNIITARSAGGACDFARELISAIKGADAAGKVMDAIISK